MVKRYTKLLASNFIKHTMNKGSAEFGMKIFPLVILVVIIMAIIEKCK